jgi:hypothetical protein
MAEFLTYKKYIDLDRASELIDLLDNHEIPYEIEDNSREVPDFFLGQDTEKQIHIKISSEQFDYVNQLLEEQARLTLENIGPDYYLFQFTDKELLDVVAKPDQWSELDVQLARKLLTDRGVSPSKMDEAVMIQAKKEELEEKDENHSGWLIAGYVSAFLGGVLGIAIGFILLTAKKTLRDGSRVYMFNENSRTHGKIMLAIGILILCTGIYYQISSHTNYIHDVF